MALVVLDAVQEIVGVLDHQHMVAGLFQFPENIFDIALDLGRVVIVKQRINVQQQETAVDHMKGQLALSGLVHIGHRGLLALGDAEQVGGFPDPGRARIDDIAVFVLAQDAGDPLDISVADEFKIRVHRTDIIFEIEQQLVLNALSSGSGICVAHGSVPVKSCVVVCWGADTGAIEFGDGPRAALG